MVFVVSAKRCGFYLTNELKTQLRDSGIIVVFLETGVLASCTVEGLPLGNCSSDGAHLDQETQGLFKVVFLLWDDGLTTGSRKWSMDWSMDWQRRRQEWTRRHI